MATHTSRDPRRKPFISIVIPVLNAERTLEETLIHLFGGVSLNGSKIPGSKHPKNKMEVLLVDGGSSDRTVEIVRRWQKRERSVRLIQVSNCRSPGQARNAGLKAAKGEFFLFLDGDCAPGPDWAGRMLEPFLSDPQVGMVGGEIHTLPFDPRNKVEHYC
jgi:glycosyltransferase involved in cell wall biosynthesis